MKCGRCPYCGVSYLNRPECPEHGLTLLPLDLPADVDGVSSVTFFADPRLGRGPVLLGASLVLIGFLLPFAGWAETKASALAVSIEAAKNLWLAPGAALGQFAILWHRRSARTMQAARLAVAGLSFGGALPLLYTTWRMRTVAAAAGQTVDWFWGLWLMLFGFALTAFGARHLGRQGKRGRDEPNRHG
jgi:hypothetical protein